MSNSVLEAMATGLPVVAASASGMSELVTPETGILVEEVDDGAALAAALAEPIADAGLRRRLGGAARDLVVERYSLESVAGALEDLYAEVLAER
jgi:glycosyltransferase involved in cell wall biosynthesis